MDNESANNSDAREQFLAFFEKIAQEVAEMPDYQRGNLMVSSQASNPTARPDMSQHVADAR